MSSRIAVRAGTLLFVAITLFTCLSAPADAALSRRWPAPPLTDPVTVYATDANRWLKLDVTKDYIVKLPADRPLTASGGLIIDGGRNVVVIGGEISIPYQGPVPAANARRGLYLKGQTGTIHIEGVLIGGSDLNEGIDLDERLGATVQLQNVRIASTIPRDAYAVPATAASRKNTCVTPPYVR